MERWAFALRMATGAVIGLVVAGLACLAVWLGFFGRIDAGIYDAFYRVRGVHPPPPNIVIVGVDESTLEKLGGWPVAPAWQVKALGNLLAAQPLAVGITAPLVPVVVGGTAPQAEAAERYARAVQESGLAQAIRQAGIVVLPAPRKPPTANMAALTAVEKRLAKQARSVGHTELTAGVDEIVRHVRLKLDQEGEERNALALEVVATALSMSTEEPAVIGGHTFSYGRLRIPVDDRGAMLINYVGPANSFETVPYWRVAEDAAGAHPCHHKIVLLGLTAPDAAEARRTPMGEAERPKMPVVEIQANAVATIYGATFLAQPSLLQLLGGITLLGLCFGAALPNLRTTDKTVLAAGIVVLTGAVSFVLFAYGGFYLPASAPVAAIVLTFAGIIIHELVRANSLISREMQAMLASVQLPDIAAGQEGVDAPLLQGLAAICSTMPVEACCVALPTYREKGNVVAYRGGDQPRARGAYLRRSDTAIWETMTRKRPLTVGNAQDSVTKALGLDQEPIRAVYVPLRGEDTSTAVLGLYQRRGRGLSRTETAVCRAAMEQALVAYGRNEVYASIRGTRHWFFGPLSDQNLEQRLAVLSAIRTATAEERAVGEAVLRSVTDGVLMFDLAGYLITCNPKAIETLQAMGVDPASVAFVEFMTWASGLTREEAIAAEAELVNQGSTWSVELDLEQTGHSYVLTANRAVGRSGKPIGIVATIADVTEFRRAARMKDELISIATHELRTPLTSVLGYAELLSSGDLSPELRQKSIEVIFRQASHLSKMIDDFLDVSRIESGREEMVLEVVDMLAAAEQVLGLLGPQAEAKQITMTAHGDGQCLAYADRSKVERVFTNLVGNAIKYSPDGARVDVYVRPGDGVVEISVQDTGYGIPKQELEHIFEKFYRVRDKQTRDIRGTGLGLSLVKLIVESHGGSITVDSEVGKGTTLAFTLPAARAAQLRAAEADAQPAAKTESGPVRTVSSPQASPARRGASGPR